HLRPAARRCAQVHYGGSRTQKLFFFVYFEKLERRAGAIALLPRLAHVRVGDVAPQPLFVRPRHALPIGESGSTADSGRGRASFAECSVPARQQNANTGGASASGSAAQ